MNSLRLPGLQRRHRSQVERYLLLPRASVRNIFISIYYYKSNKYVSYID